MEVGDEVSRGLEVKVGREGQLAGELGCEFMGQGGRCEIKFRIIDGKAKLKVAEVVIATDAQVIGTLWCIEGVGVGGKQMGRRGEGKLAIAPQSGTSAGFVVI